MHFKSAMDDIATRFCSAIAIQNDRLWVSTLVRHVEGKNLGCVVVRCASSYPTQQQGVTQHTHHAHHTLSQGHEPGEPDVLELPNLVHVHGTL